MHNVKRRPKHQLEHLVMFSDLRHNVYKIDTIYT